MSTNRLKVEWSPTAGVKVTLWDRKGNSYDLSQVCKKIAGATAPGEVWNQLSLTPPNGQSQTEIRFTAAAKEMTFDLQPAVVDQVLQVAGNPAPTYDKLIGDAALRLLRTQNSDGGWEWDNPDTIPSTGVPSPANTIGVTALGALDAYCKLGYQNLLRVCTTAYNLLVVNSADPSPSKHRIRGPDITFLAELARVLTNPVYANFAKTRWQSARAEFGAGTATGFAQYIRDVRKSQGLPAIISWDINLYIKGLLALHRVDPGGGYESQAREMAEVIYKSLYVPPLDFDMCNQNQSEYWCGITGALEAFISTERNSDRVNPLTNALVHGQQPDGHWIGVIDGSDNQTTAYAVMALLKAGRGDPVAAAIGYLEGKQLTNGGFEYVPGTENTEVTSEVIQAFYDFVS